jgi:hypothetical protein
MNQNVYVLKPLYRRLDQRIDALQGTDVGCDTMRNSTILHNDIDDASDVFLRACVHDHVSTFAGEQTGDCFANSLTGAGDDRNFAVQASVTLSVHEADSTRASIGSV